MTGALQLGVALGELELRAAGKGKRLRGRFPYGSTAALSDGGRTGRPARNASSRGPSSTGWSTRTRKFTC
jgi:hypothetical protein